MPSSKTLSILLLATSLAFIGCKKKEAAVSGSAAGAATKPAEPGAAPATPTAAATPTAPAANAMFASDDDYMNKSMAALDKMIGIFKAGGTNCDKLADDLTKFTSDNDAMFKAARTYVKAHPDAQKKVDAASQDRMAAFKTAVGPATGACQDNQKLADAMAKISGE